MQTKPLRSYGIDVTQNTMQPILESLGITDRTVKQLSQAEKEILRYIATLKQAEVAMGDMANTIESPSNQIKIFRQQLTEAKVALTSLFIGTFANILPYANAFLMVVKEVSKAVADMFGIELIDYNSGIASQEDAYSDLSDSIDGATESVKELKRQTLGFDQINNINENKDENGEGSLLDGGIDKRLLDSINGYDNGLDKVKTKASEIRDSIMEWLGFTKDINPLTGEIGFKLKDGETRFGQILDFIKNISGILKFVWDNAITFLNLIVGYKIITKLGTVFTKLSQIKDLIDKYKLGPMLGNVGGVLLGAVGGVLAGDFLTEQLYGTSFTNSLKEYSTVKKEQKENENALYTEITKQMALYEHAINTGNSKVADHMKELLFETFKNMNQKEVAYTYLLYQKNKYSLMSQYAENPLQNINDPFGDINISVQEWTDLFNELDISVGNTAESFDILKTSLSNLNSSFDTSYEQLKTYGVKFGKLGQKISEEDLVNITNSINKMCSSTNEMIEGTTDYTFGLWSDNFEGMAVLTEDEEKNILNSILNYGKKQQTELQTAQNNITGTYQKAINARGYLTQEEYNYIKEQLEKIREMTNEQMSVAETDITYYKQKARDNAEAFDKETYDNYMTARKTFEEEKKSLIQSTYNQEIISAKNMLKTGQVTQKEYDKLLTSVSEQRLTQTEQLKTDLKKTDDEIINNLKTSYAKLLDDNSFKASEYKQTIENTVKDLGYDVNEFKKLARLDGVKIGSGLEVDTNGIKTKFSDMFSNINNFIKDSIPSIFGDKFNNIFKANGGVYSNGSWNNIPQYANGGSPSRGTMFVAGEAGAEIVGNINGKTEVLNKSQIASSIYSAVVSAMSQFNGQASQIEVYVHTDEGTVVDRINQTTKQTGTCPIDIPV